MLFDWKLISKFAYPYELVNLVAAELDRCSTYNFTPTNRSFLLKFCLRMGDSWIFDNLRVWVSKASFLDGKHEHCCKNKIHIPAWRKRSGWGTEQCSVHNFRFEIQLWISPKVIVMTKPRQQQFMISCMLNSDSLWSTTNSGESIAKNCENEMTHLWY